MKKRILSIMLILSLVYSLMACGAEKQNGSTNQEGSGVTGKSPAYVEKPITIEFWHTMGSGTQSKYIEDAVKRFNENNEYGITVKATAMGDYTTLRTQLTTSLGAKNNPQVSILGMSDILASSGVLVDMKPYAERDDINLDAFYENVRTSMYYEEQLTAMPMLRSCTMYYYNADMFENSGYKTAPKDIEELVRVGKDVASKNNCYGFAMDLSPSFGQLALLDSLGAEGLIDTDKEGVSNLEDGTMLRLLKDWRSWCDEGWCWTPTVTNQTNTMYQMLYTKELASCFASSAAMTTLMENCETAGINLKAAAVPTYNGLGGVGGGGDISIIGANNNEQQIAAAWEFVKFLMSDEEVANRSKETGFLPTSDGAVALMEDYFEENPNMKAAYEARMVCQDPKGSIQLSEWQIQVNKAFSFVIQDKSMTAEEGIEYLKSMLSTVFY